MTSFIGFGVGAQLAFPPARRPAALHPAANNEEEQVMKESKGKAKKAQPPKANASAPSQKAEGLAVKPKK